MFRVHSYDFSVCVYMNSNVKTLWSNQCMPHSRDNLYWNNKHPSLVPSRETSYTGPTYSANVKPLCGNTRPGWNDTN